MAEDVVDKIVKEGEGRFLTEGHLKSSELSKLLKFLTDKKHEGILSKENASILGGIILVYLEQYKSICAFERELREAEIKDSRKKEKKKIERKKETQNSSELEVLKLKEKILQQEIELERLKAENNRASNSEINELYKSIKEDLG